MKIKKFNQINEEIYIDNYQDDKDDVFNSRYKNDDNENIQNKSSYKNFVNELKTFTKKYEKELDLYDIKKGLFEVFKKY